MYKRTTAMSTESLDTSKKKVFEAMAIMENLDFSAPDASELIADSASVITKVLITQLDTLLTQKPKDFRQEILHAINEYSQNISSTKANFDKMCMDINNDGVVNDLDFADEATKGFVLVKGKDKTLGNLFPKDTVKKLPVITPTTVAALRADLVKLQAAQNAIYSFNRQATTKEIIKALTPTITTVTMELPNNIESKTFKGQFKGLLSEYISGNNIEILDNGNLDSSPLIRIKTTATMDAKEFKEFKEALMDIYKAAPATIQALQTLNIPEPIQIFTTTAESKRTAIVALTGKGIISAEAAKLSEKLAIPFNKATDTDDVITDVSEYNTKLITDLIDKSLETVKASVKELLGQSVAEGLLIKLTEVIAAEIKTLHQLIQSNPAKTEPAVAPETVTAKKVTVPSVPAPEVKNTHQETTTNTGIYTEGFVKAEIIKNNITALFNGIQTNQSVDDIVTVYKKTLSLYIKTLFLVNTTTDITETIAKHIKEASQALRSQTTSVAAMEATSKISALSTEKNLFATTLKEYEKTFKAARKELTAGDVTLQLLKEIKIALTTYQQQQTPTKESRIAITQLNEILGEVKNISPSNTSKKELHPAVAHAAPVTFGLVFGGAMVVVGVVIGLGVLSGIAASAIIGTILVNRFLTARTDKKHHNKKHWGGVLLATAVLAIAKIFAPVASTEDVWKTTQEAFPSMKTVTLTPEDLTSQDYKDFIDLNAAVIKGNQIKQLGSTLIFGQEPLYEYVPLGQPVPGADYANTVKKADLNFMDFAQADSNQKEVPSQEGAGQ